MSVIVIKPATLADIDRGSIGLDCARRLGVDQCCDLQRSRENKGQAEKQQGPIRLTVGGQVKGAS